MGKTQNKPTFRGENTIIPITFFFHLEMLIGVNIDDQLKFDNHVSKVSRSDTTDSGTQAHEKKCYLSKLDVICLLSFIVPHFNYCSETYVAPLQQIKAPLTS